MPRTYDEIYGDDAPAYPPRPAVNETGRFDFRQMTSDITAIRKAEKAFAKQHDRLAKDGWSEQGIEDLLANYGESWVTGMLQERANARPVLRAYNLCDLPDEGAGASVAAGMASASGCTT